MAQQFLVCPLQDDEFMKSTVKAMVRTLVLLATFVCGYLACWLCLANTAWSTICLTPACFGA